MAVLFYDRSYQGLLIYIFYIHQTQYDFFLCKRIFGDTQIHRHLKKNDRTDAIKNIHIYKIR